ncbi:uncharacterized protein RSE6_10154 [Rhynchosporium secalis]|uniref:Uncharacterized protein n=1 Tax=Rhynchosporium secalis TaxID=38038 RepID=A0A1E1MJS0_RHYSE|nr:uncharacterized protein RSE6_10154 [Rhynchosporium secalis]
MWMWKWMYEANMYVYGICRIMRAESGSARNNIMEFLRSIKYSKIAVIDQYSTAAPSCSCSCSCAPRYCKNPDLTRARARSYEPATRALPSAEQVAGSGDSSALFHPEISKNSSRLLTS